MNAAAVVQDLKAFLPELCLLGGAFLVLLVDLFVKNKKILPALALLALAAAAVPAIPFRGTQALFSGFFTLDAFTHFFRLLALGASAVWVILSAGYKPLQKQYEGEYYTLVLFMALALVLMAASTNLLMIFLSIEFVSILSYLLVGFEKKNSQSKEASVKYLLFGSVASALMLYGISLVFGATGSLELTAIPAKLDDPSFYGLTLTGSILLLAGLGFKISMAPFHLWAPDAYEGAPAPFTAFLTVAPKAIGFAVLMRVLTGAFHWFSFEWSPILMVLSILTMTIGNITAVAQTNVKRLLAYSSIGQAGYILMGLAAATPLGLTAVLYYLLAYAFTNLGVFAVAIVVGSGTGSYELESYRGLAKRAPVLSACMVVFLLSLAGIPPLAGFFAKLYVFSAVIENRYYLMAAAAAINSAVAAFYYLRIVRQMYLVPADETSRIWSCPVTRFTIFILLAGTIILGLVPAPFIDYFKALLPF